MVDFLCERYMKYRTAELKFLAVVKPQTDEVAAAHAPTTCVELRQTLDILLENRQIPYETSRSQ
jgi:hypothetical protein